MDITLPFSMGDAFWFLVGLGLTGWNLYLQLEKKTLTDSVSTASTAVEKLGTRLTNLERDAWTREDHKEFRAEVNATIEKMGEALTKSIEKLGDRLDKIAQRGDLG